MQKLHLICGDKDEFQYVLITKEKVIATNLFCMLIFETESFLGQDFYNSLEDNDRFLIHKNEWIKLTKPYTSFEIVDNKIKISRKNNITDYIELKREGEDIKYNDVKIINKLHEFVYEGESIDSLTINPVMLKNFQEAIYPEVTSKGMFPLHLSFPNRFTSYFNAIKVTSNIDDLYKYEAYIMPIISKQ